MPRYSFVQQSENVIASKTRRAVRSHAMKAVRRQQRQDNTKAFRLKWPKEPSSGERFQLTRPEEELSGIEERQKRPQPEGQVQEVTLSEDLIGSVSPLKLLEPARSLGEYDPLQIDFQPGQLFDYMDPPSKGTDSLYSIERPSSSHDVAAEADEEVTPTGTKARNLLGAGRVDPFQTFPVHAHRSMSELIDHCMFSSHQTDRFPSVCSSASYHN